MTNAGFTTNSEELVARAHSHKYSTWHIFLLALVKKEPGKRQKIGNFCVEVFSFIDGKSKYYYWSVEFRWNKKVTSKRPCLEWPIRRGTSEKEKKKKLQLKLLNETAKATVLVFVWDRVCHCLACSSIQSVPTIHWTCNKYILLHYSGCLTRHLNGIFCLRCNRY